MIAVTGRISGRDLGSTIRDVQAVLARPGVVPKGIYYALGGTYAQQKSAFSGLIAVFAAAIALVFLLLLVLYRSFRTSIAMLVTTLLALSAVTIGLWITGTELNISSMMGMTMIVGIATEVAIFYVSELVSLPADLPRHEALIQAGINRMRPIAMTTVAAILALAPLALGIGAGSAMQQPLAIAIISGLVLQLPLVLLVLPVLLSRRDISR
jgi:multidrug efflux pump subunit AcrB